MAANRKRILFVDDEPSFLDTIQRIAQAWSGGEWEIFTANSAAKALSLLQKERLELVVLDIQMPVIDGIQFLNLVHRKYPNLQKVVLTGYAHENYRAACLSGGADLFLEKPRTAEAMDSILATLNELAHYRVEEGFRGVLRQVGLSDVIQMECLSRHSVLLEVTAGKRIGCIYIQDGSIVHAQIEELSGAEAFNRILSLSGGEFDLKPFSPPSQQSIEGSWEFLVMEAMRLRDEMVASAESDPSAVVELPPEEITILAPDAAVEEPMLSVSVGQGDLARKTADAEPKDGGNELTPRVDEIFICSPQGDVLFESRCPNPAQRINFMEFISQKARQLGQGLPMGCFDRIELESGYSRAVVCIRNSHGMLVRTSMTDMPCPPAAEPMRLRMVES